MKVIFGEYGTAITLSIIGLMFLVFFAVMVRYLAL